MDKKKAVELIDSMIAEQKKNDIKGAVSELLSVAKKARADKKEALIKTISEVQETLKKSESLDKIDPKTHLPGTLLDKDQSMGMGSSNMTPDRVMGKASPDMAPALDKKAELAGWMKKCMKTLTASEDINKKAGGQVFPKEGGAFRQGDKGHDKSRMAHEKGVSPTSAAAAMGKPFDQGTSTQRFGGKEAVHRKIDELKSMPKPNLPKSELQKDGTAGNPTSRIDTGFGRIIVNSEKDRNGNAIIKDDKPHPANSPEDKAHDIVEAGESVKDAAKALGNDAEKMKKMFEHLRQRQKEGMKWERSPENRKAGEMEKAEGKKSEEGEEAKDMSKEAKRAIEEPKDKPMEPGKERLGQANEPSKK